MKIQKWLCRMLCIALLTVSVCAQAPDGEAAVEQLASVLDTTPKKLLQADGVVPGDSLSDWIALVAVRNGYADDRDEYLQGLWEYVSQCYQNDGGLDPVKATIWHRISLTVLALGADPTCFGEDNQGNLINLIADGTYNWSVTDSLGTQGTNAWIYALLTLDAGGYEAPADGKYTRERIIGEILACQNEDGGFHLGSGISDVDVTAMALQALAPYQEQNEEVRGCIDPALEYLSQTQTAQGDFMNWESTSSESCSQVILALCALGIDPQSDGRFCKEGGSALDGLLLYQVSGGGFSHQLGDTADLLATEQAAQALTALERFYAGESRLYDFTEAEIHPFVPQKSLTPAWLLAGAGAAVAGIVWIWKGKKKCIR